MPVEVVKVASALILDDCGPPQVKYPVKCGIFFTQFGVTIAAGNPSLIAVALAAARQILEYYKMKDFVFKKSFITLNFFIFYFILFSSDF